jgi:hypothetical protein
MLQWCSIAAVLSALMGIAAAVAGVPLANYRSVHDLSLAVGADMSEAGAVKARLGQARTDDVRSVMFETVDGFYEFTHETYAEDNLVEVSAGVAERKDDGIAVTLNEPEEASVSIAAGTAFPTEQVVRVLEAAIAGKRFVAFDIYDGTEGGEVVYSTSTVIGQASTDAGDIGVETSIADAGFAGQRHWPVTISYFKQPAGTDMTPDYTMSIIVYENGVSRDITLDYGGFALAGKLTQLEVLPTPACPD